MLGKAAICVGATGGIGRAVAVRLAQLNADVTIVGRNEKLGNDVVAELYAANPKGKHEMIKCDAISMKSIKAACDSFSARHTKLNYIVLTQGKASVSGRDESSEGIDKKLALNYYGRILFINSLLPLLISTSKDENTRVLNIFSGGVHAPYINRDDLELKKNFTLVNAANAAGLYNDLSFDQLARDNANSNISFIHAAPGYVKTTFANELSAPLRYISKLGALFSISPERCAETMITQGLLSDHMSKGFHLMDRKGKETNKTSEHNDLNRELVWKHTLELINKALSTK